jgi:hypothetical protein
MGRGVTHRLRFRHAFLVGELTTNKAKEDAAIAWVMELERANGRQPMDTRYIKGAPADIDSPPRLIEVKACGKPAPKARGEDLLMEVPQIKAAGGNPNFYVYVVENVGQARPRRIHAPGSWRFAATATAGAS